MGDFRMSEWFHVLILYDSSQPRCAVVWRWWPWWWRGVAVAGGGRRRLAGHRGPVAPGPGRLSVTSKAVNGSGGIGDGVKPLSRVGCRCRVSLSGVAVGCRERARTMRRIWAGRRVPAAYGRWGGACGFRRAERTRCDPARNDCHTVSHRPSRTPRQSLSCPTSPLVC